MSETSAPKSLAQRLDPRQITGSAPLMPLVILFGLNAVDELDRTAFGVLTPEIKAHFGLDLAGVATLTAVILPVGLLLELPIAYLADRWNRTRMAAFGAALWAIFTVLTGFAGITTSLLVLYIARGGSALGKTFNATHNSLLADYYPQESRARVFYAHRLPTRSASSSDHLPPASSPPPSFGSCRSSSSPPRRCSSCCSRSGSRSHCGACTNGWPPAPTRKRPTSRRRPPASPKPSACCSPASQPAASTSRSRSSPHPASASARS